MTNRSQLGQGLLAVTLACWLWSCSSLPENSRSAAPVLPAAVGRVNVEPALGKIIASVCSPTPDLRLNCPLYTGHQEVFRLDGAAAAAAYNYTPTRGELVVIEDVAVLPPRASQGAALRLQVTYTVLRPTAAPEEILLIREIRYRGQQVLPASQLRLERPNGTFGDEITLTLPSPLLPGPYTVVTKILGEKAFDRRDQSFILE